MRLAGALLLLVGFSTPLVAQQDTLSVDTVLIIRPDTSRVVTVVLGCAMCANPVDTITDSAKAVPPRHIVVDSVFSGETGDGTYNVTIHYTPDRWVDSLVVRAKVAGVWLGTLYGPPDVYPNPQVFVVPCSVGAIEMQSRSWRGGQRTEPVLRVPLAFVCGDGETPPEDTGDGETPPGDTGDDETPPSSSGAAVGLILLFTHEQVQAMDTIPECYGGAVLECHDIMAAAGLFDTPVRLACGVYAGYDGTGVARFNTASGGVTHDCAVELPAMGFPNALTALNAIVDSVTTGVWLASLGPFTRWLAGW